MKSYPLKILLLALLAAFPPLSTDMYLAALPRLVEEMNSSVATVNLTLVCVFSHLLFLSAYLWPIIRQTWSAASFALWDCRLFCGKYSLCFIHEYHYVDCVEDDPGAEMARKNWSELVW